MMLWSLLMTAATWYQPLFAVVLAAVFIMPVGELTVSWPTPTRSSGVDARCKDPFELSQRLYSRFSQFVVQSGEFPFQKMFCHVLSKAFTYIQLKMVMFLSGWSVGASGMLTYELDPLKLPV